jgi:hypothetical protein
VATISGETRSLSYVPSAGFEPASPGYPGALLVGPQLRDVVPPAFATALNSRLKRHGDEDWKGHRSEELACFPLHYCLLPGRRDSNPRLPRDRCSPSRHSP